MKQQFPCPTICAMPGMPGFAIRADDGIRLLRAFVRPVLVIITIVVIAATLLFAGRSLAPFVIGGSVVGSVQLAGLAEDDSPAERELRAEADLLLQSFEGTAPEASSNSELP